MKSYLLFFVALLIPIVGNGQFYTDQELLVSSECTEPMLLQGAIVGNTLVVPYATVAYPGELNNPFYVPINDAVQYITCNGSDIGNHDPSYIYPDCATAPSPLGSKPNDTNDINNVNTNCTCCGMPVYAISEPHLSVWLHDEPLGYQPAIGPRLSLRLDYKQREAFSGFNTNWFSFGKKWNSGWLGYVAQDNNGNNVVYYPDGGSETYNGSNVDPLTQTSLTGTATTSFTLLKADGSTDMFGFVVTNGAGAFEEAFLTKRVNPQGQALSFNYANYTPGVNPVIRLISVIDGDGRTNILSYNSAGPYSTNLVTQVTDAFYRSAYLAYNANGDLTNIVDVASNSTKVYYDSNDWVTNMVTPYGPTSFAITDNGTSQTQISRAVLVTRPDSSHELYLNEDLALGVTNSYPSSALPDTSILSSYSSTFDNDSLNFHDTFYWGPRQYSNLSTTNVSSFTANDFLKADMKHWLADYGTFNASSCLAFERDPSPDVAGTIEGQKTWYDYTGKGSPGAVGTSFQPSLIGRVLPDGSTAFNFYVRNAYGLVATNISTYSASPGTIGLRTNITTYGANNVDPITVNNALNVCISSNLYNSYHEPLVSYDALNEMTVFTYNSNQQLIQEVYPNGLTVTNIYGANDLLTSTIVVGYQTNAFTYVDDLVSSSEDSLGLIKSYSWDSLSRLTGIGYPDGSSISNKYTVLDTSAQKDRMGNWTYYGYDLLERLVVVTNALGNITRYNYCVCGSLESIVDAQSNFTELAYDNQGNRTNVLYADEYSIGSAFNLLHQLVNTSDSSGNNVTNLYNNQGLLISSANSAGLLTSNVYDALDRITNSVDANNVCITNVYDNLNRILAREYPDGGIESVGYSSNYLAPTSYTNQVTNIVDCVYDLMNRKTNQVYVGVSTNAYTFDGVGDLLILTDGNKHTTTWAYDQYGRATNKVDAANNIIFKYQYDSDDRLTNRWSATKGNTVYAYDGEGNLTNVSYNVSHGIQFAYDSLDRLTGMVDAVGNTMYSYDAVGQILSEDGPWPNDTVNYSYNNRLRTGMSLQAPNAEAWSQNYAYDSARRLNNINSTVGTFGYVYDSVQLQRVDQLNLPGGSDITNSYDNVARLLSTKLIGSGRIVDSYLYSNNKLGQRSSVTRTAGDIVNYVYDNEGELKTALGEEIGGTTNRWHEQFGYNYDGAGNLYQRTNYTLLQNFGVNNLNELTTLTNAGQLTVAGSTTSPATNVTVNSLASILYADHSFASTNQSWVTGNNTYTAIAKDVYGRCSTNSVTVSLQTTNGFSYDLNGNILSDGNRNFAYDDENELIGVWVANTWSNNFVYDGKLRRRIERDYSWGGGSWTETNEVHFIYDGNVVVQERNSNDLPTVTYTRGNDLSGTLQGSGGIGGLLARTDMGQWTGGSLFATAFYHADGNGNVTCLMYPNGSLAAKYLYDPFGNTLALSGALGTANVYRFSSKEWNANSELYCYLYRYYDPNLQRWLNRDPFGELGWQVQFGAAKSKRLLDRIQTGQLLHALEMEGEVDEYSFVLNGPINNIDEEGLLTAQQVLCSAACLAACDPCFLIPSARGRAWCLLGCTTPCMAYCNGPGGCPFGPPPGPAKPRPPTHTHSRL